MSIFASDATPALIQIPSFSSPERPAQLTDQLSDQNDEGKQPRSRELTRAEERQLRFKNTNAKWSSLSRLLEEQKASGSSSLLHLMGGTVNIASALGGAKGKEKAAGVEPTKVAKRRKSTRGTSTQQEETQTATSRENASPAKKKKRERQLETEPEEETAKGDGATGKKRGQNEGARGPYEPDEVIPKERGKPVKDKKTSKVITERQSQTSPPLPLPIPLLQGTDPSTSSQSTNSVIHKPRGRVPRAAFSKTSAPISKSTPSRASPPGAPQPSLSPVQVTTLQNESLSGEPAPRRLANAVGGDGPTKKRKKPRAAPPTPAPPSRKELSPPEELVNAQDTLEEEASISQPGKARILEEERSGKKCKVKMDNVSGEKGKKSTHVEDEDADRAERDRQKEKKVARKPSLAGKATVSKEDKTGNAAAPLGERAPNVVTDIAEGKVKRPQKREAAEGLAETQKKKKKESQIDPAIGNSPPLSPTKGPSKKKTTISKPVLTRQASPSPLNSLSPPSSGQQIPALLPSPPTTSTTDSKVSKSRTKQLRIRSERFETAFTEDGKVNVFDVLVQAAKKSMEDTIDDFDEDDSHDEAKINTLRSFVASLRFSLLQRSAELSEYSALQRKLTNSKATSKKLKAELIEWKESKASRK